MTRPLVLTPGDPHGVGPEVAAAALRTLGTRAVVVGDLRAFRRWWGPLPEVADVRDAPEGVSGLHTADAEGEPLEARALVVAVRACMEGHARALVTGPIHKGRMVARGFRHRGHTEYLGELAGVGRPVMAFVGGDLRAALVTTHLPLREVAAAVTVEGVLHVARAAHRALVGSLGLKEPRLVVCGVNPHAGDGGLLGTEELEVVGPACQLLRGEGLRVIGPVSAEAAFRLHRSGGADLVVAMYHDQALAPLKLVDFGRSVNWTLGLPFVRTSVDHGTADDIAGQGVADPASMIAAIELALALTAR